MSLSDLEYGIRELAESRFFGDDSHTDEYDTAYVCYMRYLPGLFNVPNSPTSWSRCLDWSKLKLFTQSTVRPTSKPSNHQLDWSN